MQNRMIETPGAKIRENFGKSKRPTLYCTYYITYLGEHFTTANIIIIRQ